MPQASGAGGGAGAKYSYQDHDTAVVTELPPVQNQWYTLMDDDDVRLLANAIYQKNDEAVAKTLEVRWTCDGTVYLLSFGADDDVQYYISRQKYPSTEVDCLKVSNGEVAPMLEILDKRAQDFLIEVRITSALGTNQDLTAWAVYETLEVT
jgi:hypothetical protein